MSRPKRVGNPLIAVIVSLVIAAMGGYIFIEGTGGTSRIYGAVLIVLGALGAIANLVLREYYRREDQRPGQRRKR